MERQARGLILTALLSFLISAHAGAADLPGAFAPDEIQFLLRLEKDSYIMHASCTEIASALLTKAGLPAVGQTAPVRGDRLNLDRRGERSEPPMFLDGVIRSAVPYHALRLDARAAGTTWVLRLTRELRARGQPPLKLETSFIFQPESRLNHPVCELNAIEFKSLAVRASPAWAETMDTHDCIALSDLDPETASTWIKDPTYLKWAKEDCGLGLHYFGAAKNALINEAKKRTH